MISVIIPAKNERMLANTVDNIFAMAKEEIEVIVVLDGKMEYPLPAEHDGLYIYNKVGEEGIRSAINQAVGYSRGEYILKTDAHCIFGYGFDNILKYPCMDNWVVVARRWTLNLETMQRMPRIVDYYYLSCPWTHPRGTLMSQSCPWISKTEERLNMLSIDDLMCFQGSLWFMPRKHWDWLGGLEIGKETYAEHHEISMKTWLGGGRVVINKNAWYAHPAQSVRGYHMSMRQVYKDHDHSARYWTDNSWPGQVYDYAWLINKFWPLPTKNNHHRLEKYVWPEDWEFAL